MIIGFDVDGVLAAFIPAYQRLVIEHAGGLNLFHPGDDKEPPVWNWPELRGYGKVTVGKVWDTIKTSHDFWMNLGEAPGCSTLRMVILDLLRRHEVYFITNRMGHNAKWQTEQWLRIHLGIDLPTVLLTADKGLVARALSLDCYIDDYIYNAFGVIEQSPRTRMYLLDLPYNRVSPGEESWRAGQYMRVKTVGAFLDAELVNL